MTSYHVTIHTGDKKGAGTDANVWFRLQDTDERRTPWARLDTEFRDDFQPSGVDYYDVKINVPIKDVWRIELWRDDSGWSANWFVDAVIVKYQNKEYTFPVHRWVPARTAYTLEEHDCSLPQHSSTVAQRNKELAITRARYQLEEKIDGMLPQIRDLPDDEEFSVEYITNLAQRKASLRRELFGGGTFRSWGFSSYGFHDRFTDLQQLKDVFEQYDSLDTPKCISNWMDDVLFGAQRLAGVNTKLIKLCTKIPDRFAVDPSEVAASLEGCTLQEALEAKKIFICDYQLLEGIQAKSGHTLTQPLSLFYVNNDKKLVPIAIQLYQQPTAHNPVFYPGDEPYLWQLAKMWCNNADACYHQVIAHLGSTHLTMEMFYITLRRQLSVSHPITKLLAPHLQFILPVNWKGELFSEAGPLFKYMSVDYTNMVHLQVKRFRDFDITKEDFMGDLKERQAENPMLLPNYYYRDDAMLIYVAIEKYVTSFLRIYYKSEADIVADTELQAWHSELVSSRSRGGCEVKGLPEGGFKTYEEVMFLLRYIMFTSSVEHAAVNLDSYEMYAFTPFYPSLMKGTPPIDKSHRRAEDLIAVLPSRANVLEIALTAKLLGEQYWRPLGDYDVAYLTDPTVTQTCLAQFRRELSQISETIARRNENRPDIPYRALDPKRVSNYIPN